MEKKSNAAGVRAERIRDTGPRLPRIEPAEFAAGLGAEPCGEKLPTRVGLVSLAELGHDLLQRLRSCGDKPGQADASRRCQVPLSEQDVASLGEIVAAIERATGARPSLGQIASVIARMHLDTLRQAVQE